MNQHFIPEIFIYLFISILLQAIFLSLSYQNEATQMNLRKSEIAGRVTTEERLFHFPFGEMIKKLALVIFQGNFALQVHIQTFSFRAIYFKKDLIFTLFLADLAFNETIVAQTEGTYIPANCMSKEKKSNFVYSSLKKKRNLFQGSILNTGLVHVFHE